MKRRQLRKDEAKDLLGQAALCLEGVAFDKKDNIEIVNESIIMVNGSPCFFLMEGRILPLLRMFLSREVRMKTVVVDMGAVRFVTSGADVMRPGIVSIGSGISAGDPVLITDEKHGKPLAVGLALLPTEEMKAMGKGKAVRVIHYVGDKLWAIGDR